MSGATLSCLIKEIGVDYITATGRCGGDTSHLAAFGRWLVSQEVSRGCEDKPWRATGYHGRHSGSCAVGVGYQGCIVRASAQCAKEHWAQLLNLADNVTRLDLQVTVVPDCGTTATLSRHHRELIRAPRNRGKPAKFKAFYGPSGPEGVSIGSRASDRSGRAYDKGVESGLDEYAGCLRYELELHRAQAYGMAQFLDSQELDQAIIIAQVRRFLTVRGIKLGHWRSSAGASVTSDESLTGYSYPLMAAARPKAPEVVKALRWMANSVKPSVQRLIEGGYLEEVQRALGLPDFSRDNLTRNSVQLELDN